MYADDSQDIYEEQRPSKCHAFATALLHCLPMSATPVSSGETTAEPAMETVS